MTAKAIRRAWNSDPLLSKIVQFNSVAGLVGAAATSSSNGAKPEEQ
jgi:hypothetical protein